jgi:hypothetical protein
MPVLTFSEIRPLFGHRIDSPEVTAFLDRFPEHRVRKPRDGDQYVVFRSLGFDFLFRPPDGPRGGPSKHLRVLAAVFLYGEGAEGHAAFPAPPFGLTFNAGHDDLIGELGEPIKTTMPDGVLAPILGRKYWDLWCVEGLSVHGNYDPDTKLLNLITISPLG